jgi:hypothetical protein
MARSGAGYDAYFTAIQDCEQSYPVNAWQVDGVPVWPIIRIEGRSEVLLSGGDGISSPAKPPNIMARTLRLLGGLATPLTTPLRNLPDWKHEILKLQPVDALFLGDGVSHDCIDGVWRDRYCAPLAETLEADGKHSLLMQPRSQRLPRARPTYSALWIDAWGQFQARARPARSVHLPGVAQVRQHLQRSGINLTLLNEDVLKRMGVRVSAMARLFDGILAKTTPTIGFAVNYYWPIGYAFNLACRRRGILSVDIQHGGQDGCHEAYNRWSGVPAAGYPVLPAVFWNWHRNDMDAINRWANPPWHQALRGGHPQIIEWLNGKHAYSVRAHAAIADIKRRHPGSLDILVALQDVPGYDAVWSGLADLVVSSPPGWRWWLRKHPVSNTAPGLQKLLSLNLPNVVVEEASRLPLPALLMNVDTVLTLMSSIAFDASFFGHRTIFLTQDARSFWPGLLESGAGEIVSTVPMLEKKLREIELCPGRRMPSRDAPTLQSSLRTLFEMARVYRDKAVSVYKSEDW